VSNHKASCPLSYDVICIEQASTFQDVMNLGCLPSASKGLVQNF
jgi:hypothetical protein